METSAVREALLKALKEEGHLTVPQLCDHLQLPRSTISGTVKRAKARKLIRIASWTKRYGQIGPAWVPAYGLGGNPDKERPDALSAAQMAARYREAHQAKVLAKQRARRGRTVNPLLDLLR